MFCTKSLKKYIKRDDIDDGGGAMGKVFVGLQNKSQSRSPAAAVGYISNSVEKGE